MPSSFPTTRGEGLWSQPKSESSLANRKSNRHLQTTQVRDRLTRSTRDVRLLTSFSDMSGIVDAILKLQTGKCLFVGKIIDVSRVKWSFIYGLRVNQADINLH